MTRPRLLDLFCCEGGASMGYHRAGFDVTGVDLKDRSKGYPFEFHQGDALLFLAEHADEFDAFAASPPCQRFSPSVHIHPGAAETHPDLIEPTRQALIAAGKPYVIENVPEAPLRSPLLICGWAMGLKHIRRHRHFESNVWLMSPGCACPDGDSISVFGHSGEDRRKATLRASGGMRKHVPIAEVKQLMGVEWMVTREAVSESIPPAYTQYLGEQLLAHISAERAA